MVNERAGFVIASLVFVFAKNRHEGLGEGPSANIRRSRLGSLKATKSICRQSGTKSPGDYKVTGETENTRDEVIPLTVASARSRFMVGAFACAGGEKLQFYAPPSWAPGMTQELCGSAGRWAKKLSETVSLSMLNKSYRYWCTATYYC